MVTVTRTKLIRWAVVFVIGKVVILGAILALIHFSLNRPG
jgi:hypothetical protein